MRLALETNPTLSIGTKRDSDLDVAGRGDAELPPGTHVGRYVLLERLGRGGMGEVFLAHDPELDRHLALKLLRTDARNDRGKRIDEERMRREAQNLARLSHPNVVGVYDVGRWRDRTFIAMERVDGSHLGRWLREQPRALHDVVEVFLVAGKGLAAAHAAGIVHRDFKPANVMVGRDGRVRVLDFGLATEGERVLPEPDPPSPASRDAAGDDGLTETGRTVGTPAYMAPEQHRGRGADARSDQFAFCVSLYEGVVGRRPFPGGDVSCLLRAKDGHHLVPLSDPSAVPEWLMAIIDRGLQPDPDDRFPSMDALLHVLGRGIRPASSRRRLAGFAASGTITVVASVWWAVQEPSPCEHGPERLAERWSRDRAEDVRGAFLATGLGYADASFTRVAGQLDAYAEAWVDSHRRVCEAVQAHPDPDHAGLDDRMRCLAHRLDRLEATAAILAEADAEIVRRGTAIVATLPTLERCEQDLVLGSGPEPPATEEVARRVEGLRRRLATAAVLESAGRYRDGLALARATLTEAMEVDHLPLEIEARRLVGALLMASGEHAEAEAFLVDAAMAAQALPYDEIGVAAMIDLVMLLGEYLARTAEARTWAEHARAALRRSPDPRAEARLWTTEAVVDLAQGNYEESRQRAERALELRLRTLGDPHPELVGSYNALANALRRLGRFEDAELQYERALELAERVYGEHHPLTATLLLNLGGSLAEQGRAERARPVLERALDIRRRALGSSHPEVGTVLNNLGGVTWELGDRRAAPAMIREALAIQEDALGADDVKHVPLLHNLAEMLADDHPEEARRHAERALDLLERFRDPHHPRRIHTLTVLGRLAARRGELAEARRWLGQALALADEHLGVDHPLAAGPHEAFGRLELDAGTPAAAVEHLERALWLEEGQGRAAGSLAGLRFALARARWAIDGSEERVLPLLEQAATAADGALRQEIEAWRSETLLSR